MKKAVYLCLISFLISACTHTQPPVDSQGKTEPGESTVADYNLRVIVYNDNITNPELDYRSFYKVFINKIEEGRTTTGLESQRKIFEYYLQPNRHLIHIEKWMLDEKNDRYVKVNNISQPKPNFAYVDIRSNRVLVLSFEIGNNSAAMVDTRYE